jgi:hypothetical protein
VNAALKRKALKEFRAFLFVLANYANGKKFYNFYSIKNFAYIEYPFS